MTLKQLEIVNTFVQEYRSTVDEVYYRYDEDYHEEVDVKEKVGLAIQIVRDIEHAWGIYYCAEQIEIVFGIKITELLDQIEEEIRKERQLDSKLSEIDRTLSTFLRDN